MVKGETIVKRFDNRTVSVTGGARGTGASHARGFFAEGATVVIADVLERAARMLADEFGDHAIFSRLDITSVAARMHEAPLAPHTQGRKHWFRLADHIGA
jgi:NAD(P)-dependent dehydrogenase (short-subunit alcohol dehydrogenase family)